MPPQENVIALIMKRHHLPAFKIRYGREQRSEERRGQQTERRAEVVEYQFRIVVCRISVPGEFLARDPVCQGEVEGRAFGEMGDAQSGGDFVVFFEQD